MNLTTVNFYAAVQNFTEASLMLTNQLNHISFDSTVLFWFNDDNVLTHPSLPLHPITCVFSSNKHFDHLIAHSLLNVGPIV